MRTWLIWTLLAVLCWGGWAILARLAGDALNAAQQQAVSTLGILPVLAVLGFSNRLGTAQSGNRLRGTLLAVGSGLLTCAGNIAYYAVLNRGASAAAVIPLTALYPLVTILLAVALLKEPLGRIQAVGLVLSLGAIYLFNVPQGGGWLNPWIGLALVPIVLWGVSALLQKLATQHLSGEQATLGFLAAFVPVGAGLLLQNPIPSNIPLRTGLCVVLLGFAFALGNYALLMAFARGGRASIISPLASLYPMVSLPIALVFLGERPGPRETAGIVIALAAVLALAQDPAPSTPQPLSSSL